MDKFILQSFSYNEAPDAARKDIAALLNSVWPDTGVPSEPPVSHRPALLAQSFCCYAGHLPVGYAAVVRKEIFHCGQRLMIAGLSCVATHPDYRSRGIGNRLVCDATEYMTMQKEIDFGIFTCRPDLVEFYQTAGAWESCPDISLLGSHDAGALSSDVLHVSVLMRVFSERARAHKALFCKEPICLEFPVGEFL